MEGPVVVEAPWWVVRVEILEVVSIIASYGFGMPSGGGSLESSGAPPTSVSAKKLTLSSIDPISNAKIAILWNDASRNTLGVWDFGTTSQIPALKYADYDGAGDEYYCANAMRPTMGTPIPIPNCGELIPGQR